MRSAVLYFGSKSLVAMRDMQFPPSDINFWVICAAQMTQYFGSKLQVEMIDQLFSLIRESKIFMHAEGKKATPASKAADNEAERRGTIPQFFSKAIACTQFEIRHLFKIEVSLFFVIIFLSSLNLFQHGHSALRTSGLTWP